MSNAASWATTAGNKFREVSRSSENPTTKLLAEGLTALAEAVRELVGDIEYREFRGTLRHPSWKGLRPDLRELSLVVVPAS
jgi:hypothetical protein